MHRQPKQSAMPNSTVLRSVRDFLLQYDLAKEGLFAVLAIAGLLLAALPSRAGIPVFDAANLTQNITTAMNMVTQVSQTLQQITHLRDQLAQMQREFEAITGPRGMQGLARGPIEGELRTWLPGNLQDVLNAYKTGTTVAGELGARMDQIRSTYSPLRPEDFLLSGDRTQEMSAYAQHVGNTQLNHAAAERALQDLGVFADRLQMLGDQIDSTPDIKASLDLQNRLVLEGNFLSIYAVRLQALEMAQKAAEDQQGLSRLAQIRRATERARVNLGTGSYTPGLY